MPRTKIGWPALLTATIYSDPDALGSITDPVTRERQYDEVLRWLGEAESGFDKVVFCENSGADLRRFDGALDSFKRRNRSLELVSAPKQRSAEFSGKGWGEGRMVAWALHNVSTLREADSFMKITGRYLVRNIGKINQYVTAVLRLEPQVEFVLVEAEQNPSTIMETWVFWSKRSFYLEHLSDLYKLVNDEDGVYLEHVMGDRLLDLSSGHKVVKSAVRPIIEGRRGWDGRKVMSMRTRTLRRLQQLLVDPREISYLSPRM